MGVHKFYGVFVKQIKGIEVEQIPELFGLMMDLNGFAHKVAQGIFGYGKTLYNEEIPINRKNEIRKLLRTKDGFTQLKSEYLSAIGPALTEIILNKLNPTDFLIMSLDGKAPLAKGKQQLSRRLISGIERNKVTDGVPMDEKFDTAYLTAGLPFIREVSETIERWINENREFLPHYTLYSGCDVEGEGEHKIFKMLEEVKAEMIRKHQGNTDKNVDEIIRKRPIGVYGLDADIGVLCMRRDYDFVWIREQYTIREIKNGINIDVLREYITNNMSQGIDRSIITKQNEMNMMDDFTVLTFTIGDDFVPPQFPLTINIRTSIEQMMYEYSQRVKQCGFITSGDDINIPALSYMMEGMAEVEKKMYKVRQDVQNAEMTFLNDVNATGQFNRDLLTTVNNLRSENSIRLVVDPNSEEFNRYRPRSNEYYNSAPILSLPYEEYCSKWKMVLRRPCMFSDYNPIEPRTINETTCSDVELDANSDDACQDYITGLRWNFAYYRGCTMNNWFYKRSFPPTLNAVSAFLKAGKYKMEPVIRSQTDFVLSTTQMIAMVLHPTFNRGALLSFFGTDKSYNNSTINCRFLKSNKPTSVATCYQGKYYSEEHSKIVIMPQIIIEDIRRVLPMVKNEKSGQNLFQIFLGGKKGVFEDILQKKHKGKHVGIGGFNSLVKIGTGEDEVTNMPKATTIVAEMYEAPSKEKKITAPRLHSYNTEENLNKLDVFMKKQGTSTVGGNGVTGFIDRVISNNQQTYNRGGRGAQPGRGRSAERSAERSEGGRAEQGGRGSRSTERREGGRAEQGGRSNEGGGWKKKKEREVIGTMKVGRFREIRSDNNYDYTGL